MKQRTDSFKTLRTLHLSMLGGQSLFAVAVYILVQKGAIAVVDESLSRTLQVVAVLLSMAMLYLGFKVFKKKLIAVRSSRNSAEERMAQYRAACILWWAMIETPGLVSLVCYLLTANLSFFVLAVFHVLIMFLFTPRKENIYLLLNLSNQEIRRLEETTS